MALASGRWSTSWLKANISCLALSSSDTLSKKNYLFSCGIYFWYFTWFYNLHVLLFKCELSLRRSDHNRRQYQKVQANYVTVIKDGYSADVRFALKKLGRTYIAVRRDVSNDALGHVVDEGDDAGVDGEATAGRAVVRLCVGKQQAHHAHPEHVAGNCLGLTDLEQGKVFR